MLAASYFYYGESESGPPLCYFKLVFGLPCMGCGLTRAFCAMAHLRFDEAVYFHFLAPAILAWFVIWWIFEVIEQFRPEFRRPRWWGGFANALLIAMMIFYCGRMVEFFSSREGLISPLKHNMAVRLIRWDWANTYETYQDRPKHP